MKTGTSLTDAEIIKAFDCCYTDRYPDCTECPRYNREKEGCMDVGNGNLFDLPKAVTDLINRYQATINRLKAENKNCGVKIQNQREQLKACNEKIKEQQAEIERLAPENERLYGKVEELSLVLSDTIKIKYKEAKSEAYKEFVEAYKNQIKNYTGMFTDEGFYVSLEAVLSAVDFIFEKLKGNAVR